MFCQRVQLAWAATASAGGRGAGCAGQTIEQAIAKSADLFSKVERICEELGLVVAFEIEPLFVFSTDDHLEGDF
ncbi:MAG: hypothetical protein M2R45_05003 [Verrucomicrobia subdivision 3 bacterium]|nr:hypothetical protein [Limisphaerales bacterium]MCS1415600.1 hypothetical protein [Limisphaerales bacterium]